MYLENYIAEIKILCQKNKVKNLYAFGYVLTDGFSDDSDIDILISFKDISIEEYTDNYFELHYKLEELFKRKVDLLTENSLSNPFFIKSIEATKQILYAS